MYPHLMYRDRGFDPDRPLPPHHEELIRDLELETIFRAMADGDEFLHDVAKRALLLGFEDDRETVLFRQAVLKDCLKNAAVAREMYDLAVAAIEDRRKQWLGIFGNYPGGILSGAVGLLDMLTAKLGKLKQIADRHAGAFESEGFRALFSVLQSELADDYLCAIQGHLKELRFDRGVLISAQLGQGNAGRNHVLRRPARKEAGWIRRMLARRSAFTFQIGPRDEAGARALSELEDRGINRVANSVAQSADHVVSFFAALGAELAFYLGGVNLGRRLAEKGVPVCFPRPEPFGSRRRACVGLRDPVLALSSERGVVGNDLAADGKNIVVVTGANQGGKSTFLRSVGVAQHMMQCGLYVAAESFRAGLCRRLFTHYKREEDKTMASGKFDEELRRMSGIVDALQPDSLVLFNESFAATNEREGSEIAWQIVRALLEQGVQAFYVTHLYPLARVLRERRPDDALLLAAERRPDGRRTFRLLPGQPSETSFGVDLYREIFEGRPAAGECTSLSVNNPC